MKAPKVGKKIKTYKARKKMKLLKQRHEGTWSSNGKKAREILNLEHSNKSWRLGITGEENFCAVREKKLKK